MFFFLKFKQIAVSNVPDSLNGWEDDFVVPSQFSEATMLAIGNENLTSTARAEIVQMTSAKMLSYCKYPTTLQYEVVASKIVSSLLKGKGDSIGNGYVSVLQNYVASFILICNTGFLDKTTTKPLPKSSAQA